MQSIDFHTARRARLQQWLDIDENTKPKVYGLIFESAQMSSLSYWLEIIFSAAIATFGLVLNSPAVIIGAMLISPLMGPIMATGLALTVGDLYLAFRAIVNLILSIAASIGLSAFIVWLLPFHSETSEILARTNPNLLDLGVAVFSGLAGSLVVCRGAGQAGVTALPGVAIAVALMPPLCTMGFGLGSGGNLEVMGGAGLLFLTNLVAIVSSAFLVFFSVGMNSAAVSAEMRRAQGKDPAARRLSRGPLARMFSDGGRVRWRILLLAVILGSIAVPLYRALVQVAGEAVARAAVQTTLRRLAPSDILVSEQVEVGRDAIAIRLVSTRNISASDITNARQSIARRTGRPVDLTVQEIASRSELADLVARMKSPAPPTPPAPEKSLDEIRKELLSRVAPAVNAVWPAEAPLQSFDLAFDSTGIVCNVRYQAEKDLGDLLTDVILRDLRDKLKTTEIALNATRVRPPRSPQIRRVPGR